MQIIFFKKIDKYKVICLLSLFLIFFVSEESLLFGTSDITLFRSVGKFIGFILLVPFFFLLHIFKRKIDLSTLVVSSVMSICLLVTSFFYDGYFKLAFLEISFLMCGVLFVSIFKYSLFKECFCTIIFITSIVSLFLFGVHAFFEPLFHLLPKVTNFLGFQYNTIYLASLPSDSLIVRNMAFFREPGVYAIFLCIAMFYELGKEQKSVFKIFVYLVSIYFSYSTTGYLCSFLFVLYSVVSKSLKKKYLLIFVVFLFVFLLDDDAVFLVFNKVSDGSNNGSFSARTMSVYANIVLFMQNPLFGLGEYNTAAEFSNIAEAALGKKISDNTNTFLILFASYGFLYGFICLIGWLSVFLKEKIKYPLIVMLIFLFLFSSESFTHNMVFYIMIMYGFSSSVGESEYLRNLIRSSNGCC